MGLSEQDDLLAAIDYLAAQPDVDARHIGILGLSMGSVVALLVAARDQRVRTVVAECPYATAEAIMTRALQHFYHLPRFPFAVAAKRLVELRLGASIDIADAINVVRRISPRPLMFIADEADAVVGPEEARKLFDSAMACANDLGLLSEEFDATTGAMLGNFPQAFSHLAMINTAVQLQQAADGSPLSPDRT